MKKRLFKYANTAKFVYIMIFISSVLISLFLFADIYSSNVDLQFREIINSDKNHIEFVKQSIYIETKNIIEKSEIVADLSREIINHPDNFRIWFEEISLESIPQLQMIVGYTSSNSLLYKSFFTDPELTFNDETLSSLMKNESYSILMHQTDSNGENHLLLIVNRNYILADNTEKNILLSIDISDLIRNILYRTITAYDEEANFFLVSKKGNTILCENETCNENLKTETEDLIKNYADPNYGSSFPYEENFYYELDKHNHYFIWDEINVLQTKLYIVLASTKDDIELIIDTMIENIIIVCLFLFGVVIISGLLFHYFETRKSKKISKHLRNIIEEQTGLLKHNIEEMEDRNQQMTRAKKELEKANKVLESIFSNTTQSFIILDKEFNIKGYNKVAKSRIESLFGKKAAEGKNVIEFIDESRIEEVKGILKQTFTGFKGSYEMDNINPEGEEVWTEYHVSPVLEKGEVTGIFISFFDITKRKNYERELQSTTENLEKTLKESKLYYDMIEAIISVDEPEEIFNLICNKLATYFHLPIVSISLYNEEKNKFTVVGEYVKEGIKTILGKTISLQNDLPSRFLIENKSPYLIEDSSFSNMNKSIENIYIERKFVTVLLIPLIMDGEVIGQVGLDSLNRIEFSDHEIKFASSITNSAVSVIRKALLRKELEKAKEEAEESNKSKSSFLARMSHEFRTPLNGIIGMSDILSHSSLSKDQTDYIETIKYSADNLLYLVNDILDFSKIESGKLELEKTTINLPDFIDKIKKMFETLTNSKGLYFKMIMQEDCHLSVKGDPVRIRQILINLLGNAIKFTKTGGISLKIDKINSDDLRKEIMIRFSVEDTGIGIPKESTKKIFESFEQSDASITREFGGTGLGLAICKNLVEMMNGSIEVRSELSKGSEFSFTLPLEIAESKEEKYQQELEKVEISKNLKIMLVEDNPINIKVFVSYLKDFNFDITIAENGSEAIKCFQQKDFDIIFMDIQMPVMDGYTATKKIREIEKDNNLEETTIIAMSAHSIEEEKEKATESGMNNFISKPVRKNSLLKFILHFSKSDTDKDELKEETNGIDTLKFLKNYAEDKEVILEIIDIYKKSCDENMKFLSDKIGEKDYFSVYSHAHTIKSTFGYFYAYNAFDISVEIEKSAKDEDYEKLWGLYSKLKNETDIIKSDLEDIINNL